MNIRAKRLKIMFLKKEKIHSFSDFAAIGALSGEKVKIDQIINQEIKVLEYKVAPSKMKNFDKSETTAPESESTETRKNCLHLRFEWNSKECILFSGSEVLIKQCHEHGSQMPFMAKIKKINNYYTFS
jgi:hypothetical protein